MLTPLSHETVKTLNWIFSVAGHVITGDLKLFQIQTFKDKNII